LGLKTIQCSFDSEKPQNVVFLVSLIASAIGSPVPNECLEFSKQVKFNLSLHLLKGKAQYN